MNYPKYSESTLNQSSFYNPEPRRKFNPEVIDKLISYVEQTLDAKLKSISNLVNKNKKNLNAVKKEFSASELEVMKIQRSENAGEGGSLLSEDIKFFFNMVKTKPENEELQSMDVKNGKPSPRFGKKSMARRKKSLKNGNGVSKGRKASSHQSRTR